MASRLPGIGFHSSGDLMNCDESKLMTPSRSRMMSFMAGRDRALRSGMRFHAQGWAWPRAKHGGFSHTDKREMSAT